MRIAAVFLALLLTMFTSGAQIMISGNENKIDLTNGVSTVVSDAVPDPINILIRAHRIVLRPCA